LELVGAPRPIAQSLSLQRPPHALTVPTARLCSPSNQRHDLDRT